MPKELTTIERKSLEQDKAIVRKGMATFVDVGKALMRIRDGRLYRETHKTFEAFCQAEFSLERRRAYQLIESADVAENVKHVSQKPANARQAQALSSVPKEEQPAVWEEVVNSAPIDSKGEKKITTKHVETVVEAKVSQQASIVLDALKREVPKHLTEKHATAAVIQSAASKLDAVKHVLEELNGAEGAEFVPISKFIEELKNLKAEISRTRYYTECPRCKGKVKSDCDRCDGHGFIPYARKGMLSQEDKDYLGVE